MQAKYAYRSIAEFVRHVTLNSEVHVAANPFPELHRPPLDVSTTDEPDHDERHEASQNAKDIHGKARVEGARTRSDVNIYKANEAAVSEAAAQDNEQVDKMPEGENGRVSSGMVKDVTDVRMIRERVDVHGVVRPMEAPEECAVLRIRPEEVGLLKEGPLNKWWSGQKEWDAKFKRSAARAQRKRTKNEAVAKRILENAREQGLLLVHESLTAGPPPLQPPRLTSNMSTLSSFSRPGRIDNDRRWGPLDLEHENVPLSAIANRRDTVSFSDTY